MRRKTDFFTKALVAGAFLSLFGGKAHAPSGGKQAGKPPAKAVASRIQLKGVPFGSEVKCVALDEEKKLLYVVHAKNGDYGLAVGGVGKPLSPATVHWSGARAFDKAVSIHFTAGGRLWHLFLPGENKERSVTLTRPLLNPGGESIAAWMKLVRMRVDPLEVDLRNELAGAENERVRQWVEALVKSYGSGFQEVPKGEGDLKKLKVLDGMGVRN